MEKISTIILLWVTVQVIKAQDVHFSQFQAAPIHLNPAMVGILNDGAVLTLNYRTQWQPVLGNDGAFRTTAATFEKRMPVKSIDFFTAGIGLGQDKAGAIQQNEGKLAIGYGRMLTQLGAGYAYLIGGAQGGIIQQSVDPTSRRWLSQYDGNGGFDASKQGEMVDYPRKSVLDVSLGMSFYVAYPTRNYWVVGAAVHHLNQADLSITKYSIFPVQAKRYTVHAAGNFRVGSSPVRILPSALMMQQGSSFELMPGLAAKWVFANDEYKALQIGGLVRLVNKLEYGLMRDAMIGYVRVDMGHFTLGMSYDINLSPLNAVNRANSATELALSYRFGSLSRTVKKLVTPRYFD